MTTLSNPPDANAPTAPSLGADVEMLNNQLTASSNNHPPLTVVTAAAATAAASVDTGVAFAAAVAGTVDVDVIATVNNATVFPAPPSEFSIQVVAAATAEQFQVGMCYDSEDIIVKEVRAFAAKYYFKAGKIERCFMRCSRAANSHSKKKAAGEIVLQKKETSLVTDCPWFVKWSTGKKTEITGVNTQHNHPLDVPSVVMSQKKAGTSVQSAISQVTEILAPLIRSGKKIECNLLRHTISPYISSGVILDDVAIRSILRGVCREMQAGNYKAPEPIIGANELKAFTSVDISSMNCGKVLDELLANVNTNGDNSWIVTRLMQRLKADDPYFDFRLHTDENDHVNVVTWQVGACRGALQKYGDIVFLDTRNNENMNCLNMQYMSFVIIDGNKEMWPASESFVFHESNELYGVVVDFTLDMTPNFSRDSVKLGFGDLFISQDLAKTWFPNITWLVDTYHFCSPKKKDNVLVKSFGPRYWPVISEDMRAAVYAKTEKECLVSVIHTYSNSFMCKTTTSANHM